jgi:hypothetical protein
VRILFNLGYLTEVKRRVETPSKPSVSADRAEVERLPVEKNVLVTLPNNEVRLLFLRLSLAGLSLSFTHTFYWAEILSFP